MINIKDINDNMIVLKDPVRLTVIRDIDAIKRVLEMCYVLNNRSNRTLDSGIQSYID